MTRDAWRVDSIQNALGEEKLDALVCSLPSNVLMLTGYWPVVGTSLAIVAPGPHTALIVPEDEYDLASQGWADEIRTFQPGSLEDLRTPEEAIRAPLKEMLRSFGPCQRVGFESGGMVEPASYAAMYLFGANILTLLGEACSTAKLIASSACLSRLRSVKSPLEIEHIRCACQIAAAAFQTGACKLGLGLTENQAAERFHQGLCESPRHSSRIGGFTWCMSGPNSAKACAAYARSEQRILASGDLILIHCNSFADGFWTDITRTYFLGTADDRIHRMFEAVFASRAAAWDAIRPGVKAVAVDNAAREVFRDFGCEKEFKHSVGHGAGFGAISAQAVPRLHPNSDDVLQPGMVFNLEPALYYEGYGGLRHCDMVAVTSNGKELLTPFQVTLEDLFAAHTGENLLNRPTAQM